MKAKQIKITPSVASAILAHNHDNRRIRSANIAYWSTCLKNGEAMLTPQGVALEGTLKNPIRLLDGQHRLMAIVATGIPMDSFVFEECDPLIFKFIDCGTKRSLGDLTGMDRHTVQLVRMFSRIYSRHRRLTSTEAEKIAELLGDHGISGGNRAFTTSVAVKMAFAMHKSRTGENFYPVWRDAKFAEMTKALHNLYAFMTSGPVEQGTEDEKLFVFLKTYKALENPNDAPRCKKQKLYTRAKRIVEECAPDLHQYLCTL